MIQDETLPGADAIVAEVESATPDVVALAELVSMAVRVEPELLRSMRLAMLPKAHAATEADLWFSPLVESRGPGGFVLDGDVAQVLRARLRTNPGRLNSARAIIESVHVRLTPAIRLEEELTFVALAPMAAADRASDIQTGLRRVLKTMVTEETREDDLARWALRAVPRLPEGARNSEAGWLLALSAGARLDGREVMSGEPPPGAVDDLQALLPTKSEPVTIGARLVMDGVELSYPADPRAHALQVPNTTPIVLSTRGDQERTRRQSTLRWDQVRVASTHGQAARIETSDGAVFGLNAPVPDLTVTLVSDPTQPDLMRLTFESENPALKVDPSPIAMRVSGAQASEIADQVRENGGAGADLDRLLDIGRQIARFLPPPFWEVYGRAFAAVPNRVPSLLIRTDDPLIPWELAAVPDQQQRTSTREPFLGQQVDLGTWIINSTSPAPAPLAVSVSTIVVVAATADLTLPGTVAEVDELVSRRGATQIAPSLERLKPWLDGRYQPDIIHISGVAAVERDGRGSIPMNDGKLDETAFIPPRLSGVFVFLNVDSVGRAGSLITQILAAGAAGVIAPPARLDDRGAQVLASQFYERAFAGTPPAAVLRNLRVEAMEPSDRDRTAIRFRYFGHPSTTLTVGYSAAVWDVAKGEVVATLVGHQGPIRSIDYSADGSLIVTGSDDGTARVWRAATGRQLYTFPASAPVWRVAFSPDGSRIVALSNDEQVTVFALGAGIQLAVGPGAEISAIAWSPAGDRIAYVDRQRIGIFDTLAGNRASEEYRANRPTAIVWSGPRLIVADGDSSLIVIEGDGTGRTERVGLEITPITALAAFPDGARLASVDAGRAIGIWNLSGSYAIVGSAPDGVVQSLRVVGDDVLAVTDQGLIGAWGVVARTDGRSFPPIAPNQGAVLAPDGAHVTTFARHPAGRAYTNPYGQSSASEPPAPGNDPNSPPPP